ncbi:MAG: hypothetical protein M3141_00210, partial [Actinomycetota bacterium]|nr:hypothetical protein [Actinomycetota bacterium]
MFAGALLAGSAGAPPAGADLIATADSRSGGAYKLLRVNATTGATLALSPGVNEPGDQTHPSISPNRRYLVFRRTYQGTVRIVMVDRATGQSADLFNGFEVASDPPTTPTFSADGTKVLTGRRLERLAANAPPGTLQASYTETDVTNFPNGPFPHRVVPTAATDSTAAGRTLQLTPFSTARFAFGIDYDSNGPRARIAVQQSGATSTLFDADEHLRNPTI